jgi:hypothetical protein
MENEDYRIINLHNNMLKVYRDGRIEKYFIYTDNRRNRVYNRSNKEIWIPMVEKKEKDGYIRIGLTNNESIRKFFNLNRIMAYAYLNFDLNIHHTILQIDHINSIRNDNRLENLQILTPSQNVKKQQKIIDSKGYYFRKPRKKYEVQINVNKKKIYLGLYKTEACARYAYLTARNHYNKY